MNKKTLKVLHLASFDGNIGDCANHTGTRAELERNLDFHLEYTNLEMRRFFWKELNFDTDFVELANQHDLVIIGGGNYFELWVDHSRTGTSIDISLEALAKIKTPTLFYALGVDPGQGASPQALGRFKSFIDFIKDKPQFLISVRNDGAIDAVREHLGEAYVRYFNEVPDGGFFTQVNTSAIIPGVDFNVDKVVGINIASDMPESRFGLPSQHDRVSYDGFVTEMAECINRILSENIADKVIFFPHIFRDLSAIADVVNQVNDKLRRTRLVVAPYASGFESQRMIFGLYSQCYATLAMRFHANVCSFSQHTPAVGLVNYRQIEKLYQGLDLTDWTVRVDHLNFGQAIIERLKHIDQNYEQYVLQTEKTTDQLLANIRDFHAVVNQWLNEVVTVDHKEAEVESVHSSL